MTALFANIKEVFCSLKLFLFIKFWEEITVSFKRGITIISY